MTKWLASFPESQRLRVATRRLKNGIANNVQGNGFWAAKEYYEKKGMQLPDKLGIMQTLSKSLERMNNGSNVFTTDSPQHRGHSSRVTNEGNSRGKPARRTDKPGFRGEGKRRGKGMGVHSMRGSVPAMGGGGRSPKKSKTIPHVTQPRRGKSKAQSVEL